MDLTKMNFSQAQVEKLISLLGDIMQENSNPQPSESFAAKVDQKAEESIDKKIKAYKKKINKPEYINNCFRVAIQDHFDEEMQDLIIKNLDQGRRKNDWSSMIGVYNKVKNLHLRQLLLAISALYRLQFVDHSTKDKKLRVRISHLRSQVKYASACDTCGMIAKEVTEYLASKF